MKNKLKKIIICFVLILSTFLLTTNIFKTGVVFADTNNTKYTDVLQDLKRDNNFNTENYLVNNEDYSLQIIQIAENVENKLFIYVYQPCAGNFDLKATCINMSLGKSNEDTSTNKLYNLSFVNSNGVFVKYLVDGLTVNVEEETRFYNITSIYRKWFEKYDTGLEKINDNIVTEVAFGVGLCFSVRTGENGERYYGCTKIDYVTITSKYAGLIRYSDVLGLKNKDVFFVAFSCDRPIDKLFKANVSFVHKTYHKKVDYTGLGGGGVASVGYSLSSRGDTSYEYGEEQTEDLTMFSNSHQILQMGFILKCKYEWSDIETVEEFKEDKNFATDVVENLNDKDFVLNFWSADYKYVEDRIGGVLMYSHEYGERVTDVTILRLAFETDGVVYDLGCVDNKQSGSGLASGTGITWWDRLKNIISKILGILLVVLLLVFLAPILPFVFTALKFVIKIILKAVVFIIKLPIIIIKKIKHKGGGKNASCKNKK